MSNLVFPNLENSPTQRFIAGAELWDAGGILFGTADFVSRNPIFQFKFESWGDSDMYWDGPSSLTLFSDGHWFFQAARFANMQRTGGFIDSGNNHDFTVTVAFHNDDQCNGAVLYQQAYKMDELSYKDTRYSPTASGDDFQMRDILGIAKCASTSRGM